MFRALLLALAASLLGLRPAAAASPSFQAFVKASNPGNIDQFGTSVAISGDTMVIGAPYEASSATGVNGNQSQEDSPQSGAAYVFVRNGSTWTQQAYLKASNTGISDLFGSAVAISGDTIVVGARQESSAATGVNGDQGNNLALAAGAAYVFVRNGTAWSQQAYLKASNTDPSDQFGSAVAIDGDLILIGAPGEDSAATGINGNASLNNASASGAAYGFRRAGSAWSQIAYFKASNTGAGDAFGTAVAISHELALIGAPGEDSAASGIGGDQASNTAASAGAAYLFSFSGGSWTQQLYLKPSNPLAGSLFGSAASLSGDTLLVGAPGESSSASGVNGEGGNANSSASGAAYVYVRRGSWSQQAYLKASTNGPGDQFGGSVSLSGDVAAVGALLEDSSASGLQGDQSNNSAANAGAAYVFTRGGNAWSQQAYLKASNPGPADQFGTAIAVAGDTVVTGAPGEDSSTSGVNGTPNDSLPTAAGAAYVYTGFAPPPIEITGFTVVTGQNRSKTVSIAGKGAPLVLYFLEASEDLSPGSWQAIGKANSSTAGTFTFTPFAEPASTTRRFYRISAP